MSRKILTLCKKILEYSDDGTPVKDAIESSDYTETDLIVILASHYIKTFKKGPK